MDKLILIPLQNSGVSVVFPTSTGGFNAPTCGVEKFDANGTRLWESLVGDGQCDIIAADPSGAIRFSSLFDPASLAADGAENDSIVAQTPYTSIDPPEDFPPTDGVAYVSETLVQTMQAADGSLYLVKQIPSQVLSKLSAQGTLQWTIEAPNYTSLIGVSADRVCVFAYDGSDPALVKCYSAVDGSVLWSAGIGGYAQQSIKLLDDNEVLIASETLPSGVTHLRLVSASGVIENDVDIDSATNVAVGELFIGPSGDVVISNPDSGNIVELDKHGVQRYTTNATALGAIAVLGSLFAAPEAVAADGTTVFVVSVNNAAEETITADTVIVSPAGTVVRSIENLFGQYLIKDDVIYVQAGTNALQSMARIVRLSIVDGGTLSDVTLSRYYSSVTFDPLTGLVVATDTNASHLIDPGTANILLDMQPDCGNVVCNPFVLNTTVAADGSARVAQTVYELERGSFVRVDSFVSAPPPSTIRVDQPALDGAWYAKASSGQGFTLDYVADAKLIFMAWFTFDVPGYNDPDQLEWVTMQAIIAPGDTEADLTLARPAPGMFDGGTVAAHAVGTARATFTDCSHGRLDYQFDSSDFDGSSAQSIPITRLSPTTSPCQLADGTTAPAQNANAPANGFDARQSGSWYEPATSGQGLELTVVPAGNGYSGLIFGAWFTFDPPPGNDIQQEHWFTLQGDLSAASNGTIKLPILQTFGSSLMGNPTHNTSKVGTATLSLQGCDRGTLTYSFDDSDVAHAFAGLTGTIDLVKIGGCSEASP